MDSPLSTTNFNKSVHLLGLLLLDRENFYFSIIHFPVVVACKLPGKVSLVVYRTIVSSTTIKRECSTKHCSSGFQFDLVLVYDAGKALSLCCSVCYEYSTVGKRIPSPMSYSGGYHSTYCTCSWCFALLLLALLVL